MFLFAVNKSHNSLEQTGTLAGNLSIKHHNNDFNSDLFLLLETIGAVLYVTNSDKEEDLEEITLTDYLEFDMSKKIILNVILPTLIDCSHHFRSYKVRLSSHIHKSIPDFCLIADRPIC